LKNIDMENEKRPDKRGRKPPAKASPKASPKADVKGARKPEKKKAHPPEPEVKGPRPGGLERCPKPVDGRDVAAGKDETKETKEAKETKEKKSTKRPVKRRGGPKPRINKEMAAQLEIYAKMGLCNDDIYKIMGISNTALETYYEKEKGARERIESLKQLPTIKARQVLLERMLGNPAMGVPPDVGLCRWWVEKKNRKEFGTDYYVLEKEKQGLDADGTGAKGYTGITADLVAPEFSNFYREVRQHRYTHYREPGGRGAGRSSAISLAVVDLLMCDVNLHALVCRKIGNTIRDSVYTQILWAIEVLGLTDKFRENRSLLQITRIETGQKIYFRGLDDPFKIKSIKPPFGYIGVFWLEEADQTNGEAELRPVRQSVMRGGEKFWSFESWNTPRNKQHWINERTLNEADRDDVRTHHSTYLSLPVEWLGQPFIEEAEALKASDDNAYRHEYLGEAIGYGGEIFEKLSIERIGDETVKRFDNVRMGIDWGFQDPMAFVKVHYDKTRRVLYVFDEFVASKMTDLEVAEILKKVKNVGPRDLIYADCEDPKSIENYRRLGFYILGCTKFHGSVDHGVKFLQSMELIVIDPIRCPIAAREFSNYSLKKDTKGDYLAAINRVNDHTIDGVRYSLNDEINNYGPARSGFISGI
jgi:PBSX family phage terminase large subunit